MDILASLKNRAFRPLLAGINYGTVLFGVGFVFGVVRTLLVTPSLGRSNAVLVELPFMFLTAWLLSRFLMGAWSVRPCGADRLIVSCASFVVGMGFEFALGVTLQKQTLAQVFALIMSEESRIGLLGQIVVFLFPVIQLGFKHRANPKATLQ
jgi:hypothetical protein